MSTIKANRWAWVISSVAMAGAGLILAFLLVFTTQNGERFEAHYHWLLLANIALATLLALVILLAITRLVLRLRQRKFGSRLLLKLAGIFGLVGVVPGLLIYGVSYQFVSRSIETWFDLRVERALDAGLNLGRSTLDTLSLDLANKARVAAHRLSAPPELGAPVVSTTGVIELERLREQLGAQSVSIVNDSGKVDVSAGSDGARALRPERIPQAWRLEAQQRGAMAVVEGLDERADEPNEPNEPDVARAGKNASARRQATRNDSSSIGLNFSAARIVALAWMPDPSFSLQSRNRFLLVVQAMEPGLVRNALDVQSAYREYQQRSLGREGLKRMYIGTLTLALILAVFGAFLLAAILGQQLARPLLLLAEGVGEVARGDLRPKAIFASGDELGGLTRSFAAMTQQLADARTLADRSVQELDSARAHLQTILDNLTAGVIVFDALGRIDMVNPGATRILRLPLSAYRGRALGDLPELSDFAERLRLRFELNATDPTPGERQQWQEAFELSLPHFADPLPLLVRGAELPPDERLIVFDDLSEIVSSQRAQAWGEVARRVAHEIKNPLTPIQLSAERLQHKLDAKLEGADRLLLERSVGTIVNQVQALKTLINEFRDYARMPNAKLVPLQLNTLVTDVTGLYGQELESGLLVLQLGDGLPDILGDATLLRQVVHNLVQNAMDALHEHPPSQGHAPCVTVRTDAARHEDGRIRAVRLRVQDNGPGFPEKILKRAFEPYITTKTKGTGLGLAVVKKIADEHGALIRIRNLHAEAASDPLKSADQGYPAAHQTLIGAQVSISFSKLSSQNDEAESHL
jgi:nitrogen fixation/metabolism regulation signal transduction histidine kinase